MYVAPKVAVLAMRLVRKRKVLVLNDRFRPMGGGYWRMTQGAASVVLGDLYFLTVQYLFSLGSPSCLETLERKDTELV
eukprot:COSAG02_NODE_2596_length_8456_cov_23.592078_1_plen_78_part_00